MLIGIVVWVCVLKSGVHATLAGFVVALTIPLKHPDPAYHGSPLRHLEHSLHPWVAFMILPLFAFANAGVSFAGMTAGELTGGVATGIVLGLFVGKQIGVFVDERVADQAAASPRCRAAQRGRRCTVSRYSPASASR